MRTTVIALLALVLAVAAAAAVPASGATRGVRLVDNAFAPRTLTVRKGDTVRFRWAGRQPHNVVSRRGVRFRSPVQRSGTFSQRVRRAGSYQLICEIHPGMGMTLRVR
jgi:plastocyanin